MNNYTRYFLTCSTAMDKVAIIIPHTLICSFWGLQYFSILTESIWKVYWSTLLWENCDMEILNTELYLQTIQNPNSFHIYTCWYTLDKFLHIMIITIKIILSNTGYQYILDLQINIFPLHDLKKRKEKWKICNTTQVSDPPYTIYNLIHDI